MRGARMDLHVLALLLGLATPAFAQSTSAQPADASTEQHLVPPPSWMFNDLACAARLTTEAPPPLRVVGSQDIVIKRMLGPGDTLLISGGTAAGLQPGQEYYVRRTVSSFGAKGPDPEHPRIVHTAGWIKILGADAAVATATIVHACDGILLDDYLEPFEAPMIAAAPLAGGTPRYANMGHIAVGDEAMQNVGAGQLIGIDRGANRGVIMGQRYLVYRDKSSLLNETGGYSAAYVEGARHLPLVELGEVVVVAVRPNDATVQVLVAKDAITTGDLIAEIR